LIDRQDGVLATSCLEDRRFRAWPLTPVSVPGQDEHDVPVVGVRVDLAHRMSKLADARGEHVFRDAAVDPYHWSEVVGGSPLKSPDGLLVRASSGQVAL